MVNNNSWYRTNCWIPHEILGNSCVRLSAPDCDKRSFSEEDGDGLHRAARLSGDGSDRAGTISKFVVFAPFKNKIFPHNAVCPFSLSVYVSYFNQ